MGKDGEGGSGEGENGEKWGNPCAYKTLAWKIKKFLNNSETSVFFI